MLLSCWEYVSHGLNGLAHRIAQKTVGQVVVAVVFGLGLDGGIVCLNAIALWPAHLMVRLRQLFLTYYFKDV